MIPWRARAPSLTKPSPATSESFVTMLGGDRQALLRRVELEVERACGVRDQRDAGQQPCLERRPVLRRAPERTLQEFDALVSMPVQVPQPRQGGGETAAAFGVGC